MKQRHSKNDLPQPVLPANSIAIYEQYADKLLGYVLAILNNRKLAEDIVIKVFTNVLPKSSLISTDNFIAIWPRLIKLAQQEINFADAAKECKTVNENTTYINANRHLTKMNDIQRLAFCGVYYHRKTTADLSRESGYTEAALRLALKDAFMLIREVKDEG